MSYLDENGLLYVWQKIKSLFVQKELKTGSTTAYKVLSDNNLTDDLVTKIGNIPTKTSDITNNSGFITKDVNNLTNYTKTSELKTVATSGSYNDLTNKPTIPTNNNQLTNGAGYQTSSQVQNAINSALSGFTGISYSIVESLPAIGEPGVIYLISNSGITPNIYDEYIYVNNKFEKIGTTDIDLSGYLQISSTISNSEIDNIIV